MLIVMTKPLTALAELGVNYSDDEENEDRYDGNGYNPIRSHPGKDVSNPSQQTAVVGKGVNTYAPSPSTS